MSNINYNYDFGKRKKNPKFSLDNSLKDTLYSVLLASQSASDEVINAVNSVIKNSIVKSTSNNSDITSIIPDKIEVMEQTADSNEGKRIKDNIINVLNKNHNQSDIKGVFDKVSDSDVEKSIPTANSVMLNRLNSNKEKTENLNDYRNLHDGLALFYAASEKGDKKAAKLAYEAAYTPSRNEPLPKLTEANSKKTTVTEENNTDFVSFYKDSSNHPEIKNTENNPIQGKIYGLISRPPKKIGTERIIEITEEKEVTYKHAKIIYYSENWKNIPEYKWTSADILYWKTFGGEKFLHSKKISYIKNYKNVILDASKKYNLPPLLIAGVMYIEYGGDPSWFDDAAYKVRELNINIPKWMKDPFGISKDSELTSFGNTSIQIRRAKEMLGYTNNTDKQDKIIESLKDPIQNIYMTACHLDMLRNIDFMGKNANNLTKDEIKIIASRYNIGPEPQKNAIVTDYGQVIYDNKDEIIKALK